MRNCRRCVAVFSQSESRNAGFQPELSGMASSLPISQTRMSARTSQAAAFARQQPDYSAAGNPLTSRGEAEGHRRRKAAVRNQ